MNAKPQAREIDLRRAIMRLDLKPVAKLVFLGLLDRVDWSTMSGEVSSSAIANTLNHNRRSVVRALGDLVDLGYITRDSHRIEATRSSISVTTLNVSLILSKSSDNMTHSDALSPSDNMTHSDTSSLGVVTPCLKSSDALSLGVVTPCHTINNYQYINNDQDKSDTLSLPKRTRLNRDQVIAIEDECNRLNDSSHTTRVKIASKLFNIKLLKGGYYESL